MIKRFLLLAVLAVAQVAAAQSVVFYTDRALASNPFSGPNNVQVPSATFVSYGWVRVCNLPMVINTPCTSLAAITDVFGNPISVIGGNFGQLQTDVVGRFSFGCTPGLYEIQTAATANNNIISQYPITCPSGTSAILSTNNAFTGNNTFAGTTSTGSLNGVEVVDGIRNVNIQAAINHLPSQGGIVALPSHYRETLTNHIVLGNGTTQAVVIVGYGDDIILCEVTDGSFCFQAQNNSGFIGLNPWANGTNNDSLMIRSGPGMNVAWMVQPSGIAQASMVLEKMSIIEDGTAPAPSQGCLLIDGIGNLGIFRDLFVECRGAIGWQISSAFGFTGPFSMDNVWSLNVSTAGGIPCKILGGANSLIGISLVGGGACNDAGAGLPSLLIDGNGNSGGVKGIDLTAYAEMNCSFSNNTAIKIKDAYSVLIHGGYAPCAGSGGTGDSGIVITQSGAGFTRGVTILSTFSQFQGAGGCVLSNTITGECGPANNNTQAIISKYEYTGDSLLEPSVTSGGSDSRWVNQFGATELVASQNSVTIPTSAVIQQLNQNNAHVWADATACAGSTKTVTFANGGYTSTPTIVVSDETTVGGARVSAKSNTAFTVTCTGATDAFDWIAVGNPN